MSDVLYSADMDLTRIKQAFREIDNYLTRLERQGGRSFSQIENSAKLSAGNFALANVALDRMVNLLTNVGRIAATALKDAVQGGVEVAAAFESSEAVIRGVLDGNQQAASAFFDLVRRESRKAGIDLTELAAAFAGQVSSTEEFIRLSRIAAALAISQPEQGASGARLALLEALQGGALGLRSLRERFEFPPDALDRIQQAQEEFGTTEGLIIGLEKELQNLGRDLDSLGDTFQLALGQAQQSLKDLQAAFGEPITEALKEALGELSELTGDNFERIEYLANKLGEIVATVIDFGAGGVLKALENLDTKQVENLAQQMFDTVNAAITFVDVLADADLSGLLGSIDTVLSKLEEAAITAAKIDGLFQAENARLAAEAQAGIDLGVPDVFSRLDFTGGGGLDFAQAGLNKFFLNAEQQAQAAAAGEKAYRESLLGTVKALEDGAERREDYTKKTYESYQASKQNTEANLEEADAILAQRQALKDAENAALEFATAQEKIVDALDKISLDRQRKELDAYSKFLEQQAKQEIDLARDREKLERDFGRKIRELRIDAANDAAKKRRDIEAQAAENRADIERDYQREVKRIIEDSAKNLLEAERGRDAIQFIRLTEEREKDLRRAEEDRQDDLDSVERERQRGRAELEQLDRDLEEKIERERRYLADRQEELEIGNRQRQVEIVDNYTKELEAIDLAERRKLEDLQNSMAEQLAVLEEGLRVQLDLVDDYENAKTTIVSAEADARVEAIRAEIDALENLEKARGRAGAGRQARSPRNAGGRGSARVALGFASGTDGQFLTVPPGYPNDSFKIGLTSGEQFSVVPPNQIPTPMPVSPNVSSIMNDFRRSLSIESVQFGAGQSPADRFVTQLQLEQLFLDLLNRLG